MKDFLSIDKVLYQTGALIPMIKGVTCKKNTSDMLHCVSCINTHQVYIHIVVISLTDENTTNIITEYKRNNNHMYICLISVYTRNTV